MPDPGPDPAALALDAHAGLVEAAPGVWSDPDFDPAWLDRGITRAELAEVLDFNRSYRGGPTR